MESEIKFQFVVSNGSRPRADGQARGKIIRQALRGTHTYKTGDTDYLSPSSSSRSAVEQKDKLKGRFRYSSFRTNGKELDSIPTASRSVEVVDSKPRHMQVDSRNGNGANEICSLGNSAIDPFSSF